MFDINNLQISTVAKGLDGKTFLFYGQNSVGKTKESCKAPKPLYLGFEAGINAIAGLPFERITTWGQFKQINSVLTNPYTLDKTKEVVNTLIFDTVEASSIMCQDYICASKEVNSIAEGNKGFGLWKEYEAEYWREINKLTNSGFTVIFISHATTRAEVQPDGTTIDKVYPSGDKRAIDPICNLVDTICYIRPNGFDENYNEILSSAYMVNTPHFLSRSRFTHMPKKLQVFSMENLTKALVEAIEKEETETGIKSVDYTTFKQSQAPVERTLEELKEEAKKYAMVFHALKRMQEYVDIVKEQLPNTSVKDATKKQRQQVEVIVSQLKVLYETISTEDLATAEKFIEEQRKLQEQQTQ